MSIGINVRGSTVSDESPKDFWENRYADSERVWSGNVNATMSSLVADLSPGRALDLGCGEGGDVLWLAAGMARGRRRHLNHRRGARKGSR